MATSWKVYRDGVFLENSGDRTAYVDNLPGERRYWVTRVEDGVESAPSNVVTVNGTTEPPVEPPPVVDPPDPVEGVMIPNGGTIPTSSDKPLLLQRGGSYKWAGATLTNYVLGAFGTGADPIITNSGSSAFVCKDNVVIRGVRLKTSNDAATCFIIDGANVDIDAMLAGSEWGDAIKVSDGAGNATLSVGTEEIIGRHLLYDDSKGHARNITIDFRGKSFKGSRDENAIRIKGGKTWRVRNASGMGPCKNGTKAWLTIQAEPDCGGPEDVVVEDMMVEGPCGIGPIETQSGWQNETVRNVTLKRIESRKAGDITIMNGAQDVLLEDFSNYHVPTRTPIRFELDNPLFPKAASVTLDSVHMTGGASQFTSGGGKIVANNSTWNGHAL